MSINGRMAPVRPYSRIRAILGYQAVHVIDEIHHMGNGHYSISKSHYEWFWQPLQVFRNWR